MPPRTAMIINPISHYHTMTKTKKQVPPESKKKTQDKDKKTVLALLI